MILSEPLDEREVQNLHTAYHELEAELAALRKKATEDFDDAVRYKDALAELREAVRAVVANPPPMAKNGDVDYERWWTENDARLRQLLDEDPENPQTEYGQMKKFARDTLMGR